jgi:hypothetical protein
VKEEGLPISVEKRQPASHPLDDGQGIANIRCLALNWAASKNSERSKTTAT